MAAVVVMTVGMVAMVGIMVAATKVAGIKVLCSQPGHGDHCATAAAVEALAVLAAKAAAGVARHCS